MEMAPLLRRDGPRRFGPDTPLDLLPGQDLPGAAAIVIDLAFALPWLSSF
jgi:hypothetical protein